MILKILFIIIGLALLLKGSDIIVGAAKELSRKFKLSHTALDLTLVAVGTSLPEITTNLYIGRQNKWEGLTLVIIFGVFVLLKLLIFR